MMLRLPSLLGLETQHCHQKWPPTVPHGGLAMQMQALAVALTVRDWVGITFNVLFLSLEMNKMISWKFGTRTCVSDVKWKQDLKRAPLVAWAPSHSDLPYFLSALNLKQSCQDDFFVTAFGFCHVIQVQSSSGFYFLRAKISASWLVDGTSWEGWLRAWGISAVTERPLPLVPTLDGASFMVPWEHSWREWVHFFNGKAETPSSASNT